MRKSGFLLTGFFLAASLAAIVLSRDTIASWYLSRESGLCVELQSLSVSTAKEISFSNFRLSERKDGSAWIYAKKGALSLRPDGAAEVTLENVIPGEIIQKKLIVFSSWLNKSAPKLDHFDRVVLLAWREGGEQRVRLVSAAARDFKLAGTFVLRERQLQKLDARLDFSPTLLSGWPREVTRKMIDAGRDWRGIDRRRKTRLP